MNTTKAATRLPALDLFSQPAAPPVDDRNDDADEIRYSLTALGEVVANELRGRFRGFGPCEAGQSGRFAH